MRSQNTFSLFWILVVGLSISSFSLQANSLLDSGNLNRLCTQKFTGQQTKIALKCFWINKPLNESVIGKEQYNKWIDYWLYLPDFDFKENSWGESGKIESISSTLSFGQLNLVDYKQEMLTSNDESGMGMSECNMMKTPANIVSQCDVPKNFRLANQTPISATVEWDKVPDAESYIVAYRPTVSSEEWQYKTTKETYATISFPDLKTQYEVKVQTLCALMARSSESQVIMVSTKGDLVPGLVARYNFCNGKLVDLSPNKLDGEIKGNAVSIAGKMSDALYLYNSEKKGCDDPKSTYLQLPAFGAIWQDGFTFGTLVRFDKDNRTGSWERIFDFSNGPKKSNIILARNGYENSISAQMYSYKGDLKGDLIALDSVKDVIVADKWVFIAVTIGDSKMNIYVDGELRKITDILAPGKTDELNVVRNMNYLGKSADGWCDHNLLGSYDEIRIYNRVLTSNEISEWYKEFIGYQNTVSVSSDKYLLKDKKEFARIVALASSSQVSFEWQPTQGLSDPKIANPKAAPEVNTTYTCTITFPDGCVAYDSLKISVDYSGIDEEDLGNSIKIYPSPADDILNIKYKLPTGNIIRASLVNLLGQELGKFESIAPEGDISLSVKNLDSGIYLLKISDNFGKKVTKKILID